MKRIFAVVYPLAGYLYYVFYNNDGSVRNLAVTDFESNLVYKQKEEKIEMA